MGDLRDAGSGEGVQVLFVEEGGRYRCDEAALRRTCVGGAARGLPVAVVSVAGATRGGKSFLLDFFLRYLRAPEEARRSDAWLGADHDPLTGFSWRGGWERNTTGILLWSEPIVVTYEHDGCEKKIAVLLMDTQGTFDNDSTVKDCTTIFAMSTLISSVQIYNLAQIIKQDDLQHLQLFTEYGKLARQHDDTKAFQSLMFRVRDWMCPYEHPYGASGGESYLQTVLQADTKKAEIRELREHIRSSFERVSCFLTPHPGMAVADQNFTGRLCDLQTEFKQSILEFVPLILHPSNLIPKIINGREVTIEELPTYFRTYLEIFNGDDLPTPVSIFQATSAANLETALSACRMVYVKHMEQCGRGAACLPRDAVPRYHAAALLAARQAFEARPTLGSPALAAARLETLLQELERSLVDYVASNNAKILHVVMDARGRYDAALRGTRGDSRPLCLHPHDVPELHDEARGAALAHYDEHGPGEHDADRHELLQWLDAKGKELETSNDLNNKAACAAAGAVYAERVARAARGGTLSAARLQREHADARAAAIAALRTARLRTSRHADDEDCYLMNLVTKIDEEFSYWERSNIKSARSALRAAASEYGARMALARNGASCFHPRTLRRAHRAACDAAWDNLRQDTGADPGDSEQQELDEVLDSRFEELERSNEASCAALVTSSHAEYCRSMDVKCAPSLSSILIVPWLVKVMVQLPQHHESACKEARAHFHSRRRVDPEDEDDDDDDYLQALNKKLKKGYEIYCNPLFALAREFSLPLPATAAIRQS